MTRRGLLTLVASLVGGVQTLAGPDELVVTSPITAADHEAEEGYFYAGTELTFHARPETEPFAWLQRARQDKVPVTVVFMRGRV
jgi:hypothetical protein